jgi:hypothetical protein
MRLFLGPLACAPGLFLVAAVSCGPRESPSLNPMVRDFASITGARTARTSSFDRSGGNKDCLPADAGQTLTLAEIAGAGSILHTYIGTTTPSGALHRELILRMYWDGETSPSVEVPLGDFFLTGYEAFAKPLQTAFVVINSGTAGLGSRGYHSYIPMPFDRGAKITLENQASRRSGQFCYHIEYETYSSPHPPEIGRFHAQWRRQVRTPVSAAPEHRNQVQWPGTNKDGRENYVILEAQGKGRLLGLLLNVDNGQKGWYGEGDDMIFIDGEPWPPSYHGTGTEEIFGGGACPDEAYAGPHTGFHVTENRNGDRWSGKVSMFRWFVHDPVRFSKSIRWTIEHGHANNFENDYSSVAFWYQTEPHAAFPPLPPARDRLPQMPPEYFQAREIILGLPQTLAALESVPAGPRERLRAMRREGHVLFQQRRFAEALKTFERHAAEVRKLTSR